MDAQILRLDRNGGCDLGWERNAFLMEVLSRSLGSVGFPASAH